MRVLLDTNILVYLYDAASAHKQETAAEVVELLAGRDDAAIAAQTLAEFSAVCLRRLEPPLPEAEVTEAVQGLRSAFAVLPLTPAVVLEALRGVRDHQFAYFDAQIWAAARLAQLELLVSEDFASGATVEGLTFVNPFTSDGLALLRGA